MYIFEEIYLFRVIQKTKIDRMLSNQFVIYSAIFIFLTIVILTSVIFFKQNVVILESYSNGNKKKVKYSKRKDNFFVIKFFYADGNLNKVKKIINNDIVVGDAITYHNNGSVYLIDTYVNGKLQKSKVFDFKGKLKEEFLIEN